MIRQEDFTIKELRWRNLRRSTVCDRQRVSEAFSGDTCRIRCDNSDVLLWHRQKSFTEVADITGVILARWIERQKVELQLRFRQNLNSRKYIGSRRETIDDLQKFDADEFVNAFVLQRG